MLCRGGDGRWQDEVDRGRRSDEDLRCFVVVVVVDGGVCWRRRRRDAAQRGKGVAVLRRRRPNRLGEGRF